MTAAARFPIGTTALVARRSRPVDEFPHGRFRQHGEVVEFSETFSLIAVRFGDGVCDWFTTSELEPLDESGGNDDP